MVRKQYLVTAIPETGRDRLWRAGMPFGPAPTTITVLSEGEKPAAPYEFTPAQFRQIADEPRIKVTTQSGHPVGDEPADEPAKPPAPKK